MATISRLLKFLDLVCKRARLKILFSAKETYNFKEPTNRSNPIYIFSHLHKIVCKHTVTHCNALQHTATNCNTLQYTATHCNTLQHTATHCHTLPHTATHCNTLQHTATHCNAHRIEYTFTFQWFHVFYTPFNQNSHYYMGCENIIVFSIGLCSKRDLCFKGAY